MGAVRAMGAPASSLKNRLFVSSPALPGVRLIANPDRNTSVLVAGGTPLTPSTRR
jgi:hypothetical protein